MILSLGRNPHLLTVPSPLRVLILDPQPRHAPTHRPAAILATILAFIYSHNYSWFCFPLNLLPCCASCGHSIHIYIYKITCWKNNVANQIQDSWTCSFTRRMEHPKEVVFPLAQEDCRNWVHPFTAPTVTVTAWIPLRWLSGKESACQCRRCGFDPWIGLATFRPSCVALNKSATLSEAQGSRGALRSWDCWKNANKMTRREPLLLPWA